MAINKRGAGVVDPSRPSIVRQPYGPIVDQSIGNPEIMKRVKRWKDDIRASGMAYLQSRGFRPALVDYLALELSVYERNFCPQWYGGDNVTVPAGQYFDITRTIDPRAYFVGRQICYHAKNVANPNIALQLIEAGGYALFSRPVNANCLNNNAGNGSVVGFFFDLPRDWILSPGEAFTIRAIERDGNATEIDVHIAGTKVYARPEPEVRLPHWTPSGRPSGVRDGIGDTWVTDAQGEIHRSHDTRQPAFPGAAEVVQSVFPGLKLVSQDPQSVFEFIREEKDPGKIGMLIEAYRKTYRPGAYGKDDIVVAATVGAQQTHTFPMASDSYFVCTMLGIAKNTGEEDWTLDVIRAAGSERLFGDPVNYQCLQLAGSGMTNSAFGGSWYPLPEPWVVPPKDEVTLTVENVGGGGFECDIHLLGYKVFVV